MLKHLENNFDWAVNDYKWDGKNPYGDGDASKKIESFTASPKNFLEDVDLIKKISSQ